MCAGSRKLLIRLDLDADTRQVEDMHPLEAPALFTAMLSLDFDGTLHGPDETPPVPSAFFEGVRRLRDGRGIGWGINTGRSLEFALAGFRESAFPFGPDWLVTREREIHFPDGAGGWREHADWNSACRKKNDQLFKETWTLLAEVRRMVEDATGAQWVSMPDEPAAVVARSEEEMDWIMARVGGIVVEEPRLAWQRSTIYLRFSHRDFNKGSCLAEVAAVCGVDARNCLAMGDSHNDLEMLRPCHAGMLACPANAVGEVRAAVEQYGGWVSGESNGAAVVEALERFFPMNGRR